MSTPTRGPADYLELGTWNAHCFYCGAKRKANELVRNWKGQYVCRHHVDIQRHPQDFVRGIPDKMSAPWVQKIPDAFIDFCTTSSAVADYAIAECAVADYFLIPDEGAI